VSGFADDLNVPLISGDIFDHYMSQSRTLLGIWESAKNRRFMPIEDYITQSNETVSSIFEIALWWIRFKKHLLKAKEPWIP